MRAPTPVNDTDRRHLTDAFAYAYRDGTPTWPNPRVGCVIVAPNGDTVAFGASRSAGGAHAEIVALDAASDKARGATVYVTLEPCDHYGRTPPCTKSLIDAGVARVVYALADPNPAARGGAATLAANGITVAGPLAAHDPLAYAIADDLAAFLARVTQNRPYVTLKLAQQADGNTRPEQATYLTGVAARQSVHRLRATADVILVGSGTVQSDNPLLTVRDTGGAAVLPGATPQAVIFDRALTTPPNAHVCRPGTRLLTASGHTDQALLSYRRRGVEILEFAAYGNDQDDARAGLATLAHAGIGHVFAEPGLTLAHALIAADAVDRLVLHIAGGAPNGTFTPCVPLDTFKLQSSGEFAPNDTAFTFVSKRKTA